MDKEFKVSFSDKIDVILNKNYEGSYAVTPTDDTQILATKEKVMVQDVIVHPVPNSYGRVSYDSENKILEIL